MIKVLHIVPTTSKSSGIMSFIMSYYKKINKNNIQFDFLCFKDISTTFDEEIKNLGGNVYTIKKPFTSGRKNLRDFFKTHKNEYSIMHCHPIFSFLLYSKYAKKYGNIKNIIQHSHTTKFSDKKFSAIRNRIIMLFAPFFVTHYAACSVDALRCLPKNDVRKKGYKIINNAIESKKFIFDEKIREEVRKEFCIDDKITIIGNVGRFCNQKNQLLLLDLFKKYNDNNKNSKLMLVGRGPLENQIKEKATKLGIINNIIFTGIRSDVNRLLCAMDFFVLPSDFEGLGIVAIEAQASGLVTFCSLGVPNSAIITNDCYRFDIYDLNSVDNTVKMILDKNNYKRNNNQEKIIAAGYDIATEVNNLEKYYKSICE